MAFSSRSGSTFISREIETRFEVSRMREAFNPTRLNTEGLVLRPGWFAFKAGVHGFIVAEKLGFFDAYLPQTHFLLLFRRDVVAQAVSAVKAKQQGVWHSTAKKDPKPAEYDPEKIGSTIQNIVESMFTLRAMLNRAQRPFVKIFYEDCVADFSAVDAACESFGVPRRMSATKPKPVEKVGDDVNEEWIARYKAEMTPEMADVLRRYVRFSNS